MSRPACRSCNHPMHQGLCTARSGGTALACRCSAQDDHEHEWTTDGCHANEFCRHCFRSKPRDDVNGGAS